jgi:hypothetical protein
VKTKTLIAIAISAAVVSSPIFAQESAAPKKPVRALRHYRSSYNQVQEPAFVAPREAAVGSSFDRSYDPSRIGDHDPSFNPPN